MRAAPLSALRVAVTRARAQAGDLADALRQAGAQVLLAPLIRITPDIEREPVRTALCSLADYDWLVFTSANGVDLFMQGARRAGVTPDAFGALRVACVGPATASAAERHGIHVDAVPAEFIGDAIAGALAQRGSLREARILLARAHGAREALPRLLAEQGARVTDLELYRSDPDEDGAALLRSAIASDVVDVVTFTSGSTVRYFARLVGSPGRAAVAVIGPATAEAAVTLGLPVAVQADPHTADGLVAAIIRHVAGGRSQEDLE